MESKSYGCLLGITLFWCGIVGVFLTVIMTTIVRQVDAQRRFHETEGVVLSSKVLTSRGSKGSTLYRPEVRYRYSVRGKDYVSDRYTFESSSSSDDALTRRVLAECPVGKRLQVYYDPDRPEVAILSLGIPTTLWFMLLFLQPFLLVGVALLWGLVAFFPALRRVKKFLDAPPSLPWTIPSWGTLRSSTGGLTIEYRISTLALMAVTYGLCTFLCTILGAILLGGFSEPSGRTVTGLFAGSAVAGVLGGWRWSVKSRQSLELDPVAKILTLVTSKGERTVSAKEIEELIVYRPPRRTKGGTRPGDPRLAAILKGGGEVPLHDFAGIGEAEEVAKKAGEFLASSAHLPFRMADRRPHRT